jgi:hypothetical protein
VHRAVIAEKYRLHSDWIGEVRLVTVLRGFAILYFILSLVAVASLWRRRCWSIETERALLQRGLKVPGQIVGWISSNIASTYLPFTYEYAGKVYHRRQWVSKCYANMFSMGSSVEVLLLSDKPEVAMLADISPGQREAQVLRRQIRVSMIILCLNILILLLLFVSNL